MSDWTFVKEATPATPSTNQVTVYADTADKNVKAVDDTGRITTLGDTAINVKDKGAKGDGLSVTDGAITSGLAVLTSASALFVSTDVGKAISVSMAGGTAITKPGAPTVTPVAGSSLPAGAYKYMVTFVSAYGETDGGTEATATTSAANLAVSITNIPTGGAGTLRRRIYRTAIGGATGTEKLLTELPDNTTTTFSDSTPDAVLAAWGVAVPTINSSGASLFTTVSVYTSATTVTLAATASASATGATVYWGTDDTTAIKNAIAAVSTTTGGAVYFPPGVFMISKDSGGAYCLNLVSKLHLYGAGQNISIIRLAGNQASSTRMFSGTSVTDVTVTDLGFDGNRYNQPLDASAYQSHPLFFNTCTSIRVEGCTIANSAGDGVQFYAPAGTPTDRVQCLSNRIQNSARQGITLDSVKNALIADNLIQDSGLSGIDIEPDATTQIIRDVTLCDNQILRSIGTTGSVAGITVAGRVDVDSENFRRVSVTGNVVDQVLVGDGIIVSCIPECVVTGNTVKNVAEYGLYIRAPKCTVTGNYFADIGKQTIVVNTVGGSVHTMQYISITGNTIFNGGLATGANAVIQLTGANDCTVSDNTILAVNGEIGIRLLTGSVRCVVSGNVLTCAALSGAGVGLYEQDTSNNNTFDSNIVTNFNSAILTVGAATRLFGNANAASSSATFTAPLVNLGAGTTAIAPLVYASGTNLTAAAVGATEFDGAAFYTTVDTTTGRRINDAWQYFRLTANGSGITTIADFFGTNDGIPTVLNAVYDIEWHCYWAHTTTGTGTITWTIVNTQTVTNMVAEYMQCPVGGIGTVGTPQTAGVITQTAASVALPVTGVNTAIASHYAKVHAVIEAATAGNVRLRMTASAGTATPQRGSFFRVRRLPAANVGTYVA